MTEKRRPLEVAFFVEKSAWHLPTRLVCLFVCVVRTASIAKSLSVADVAQ